MSKNMNKLTITGPNDRLQTIIERFRGYEGVEFAWADNEGSEDSEKNEDGTDKPGHVNENAFERNTKETLEAAPQTTRLAPNMVDPAVVYNQPMTARTGVNSQEFQEKVKAEVDKRAAAENNQKVVEEKASRSSAQRQTKQVKPEEDKADKSAASRSTKKDGE